MYGMSTYVDLISDGKCMGHIQSSHGSYGPMVNMPMESPVKMLVLCMGKIFPSGPELMKTCDLFSKKSPPQKKMGTIWFVSYTPVI